MIVKRIHVMLHTIYILSVSVVDKHILLHHQP